MHLTIDRLLTLRDASLAEVSQLEHLRACAECSQALESLRARREKLLQLSEKTPPDHAWNAIQQSLNQPASSTRFAKASAALALTAVVAVSISLISIKNSTDLQNTNQPLQPVAMQSDDTAQLVAQSQELEEVLHQLPRRPSIQRVAIAAAIDDLETSIQLVDAQLSSVDAAAISKAQSEQLWRQRVELMTSLVNVRYAQASEVSL
jgi:predicted nucleic acid-binding protein